MGACRDALATWGAAATGGVALDVATAGAAVVLAGVVEAVATRVVAVGVSEPVGLEDADVEAWLSGVLMASALPEAREERERDVELCPPIAASVFSPDTRELAGVAPARWRPTLSSARVLPDARCWC